jgi:hypothetical protein
MIKETNKRLVEIVDYVTEDGKVFSIDITNQLSIAKDYARKHDNNYLTFYDFRHFKVERELLKEFNIDTWKHFKFELFRNYINPNNTNTNRSSVYKHKSDPVSINIINDIKSKEDLINFIKEEVMLKKIGVWSRNNKDIDHYTLNNYYFNEINILELCKLLFDSKMFQLSDFKKVEHDNCIDLFNQLIENSIETNDVKLLKYSLEKGFEITSQNIYDAFNKYDEDSKNLLTNPLKEEYVEFSYDYPFTSSEKIWGDKKNEKYNNHCTFVRSFKNIEIIKLLLTNYKQNLDDLTVNLVEQFSSYNHLYLFYSLSKELKLPMLMLKTDINTVIILDTLLSSKNIGYENKRVIYYKQRGSSWPYSIGTLTSKSFKIPPIEITEEIFLKQPLKAKVRKTIGPVIECLKDLGVSSEKILLYLIKNKLLLSDECRGVVKTILPESLILMRELEGMVPRVNNKECVGTSYGYYEDGFGILFENQYLNPDNLNTLKKTYLNKTIVYRDELFTVGKIELRDTKDSAKLCMQLIDKKEITLEYIKELMQDSALEQRKIELAKQIEQLTKEKELLEKI